MPHSALEFPLLPGESASGFLLRVAPIVRPSIRAEIDYFLGLDDALASAVFRNELAVSIAETLGTSRYDMLAAMIHKSAGYYTLGDFHLRTGQITQWRRRVSPSVLNLEARYGCFPPHHRLVWSIDALNYDPEYRCRIVDACPRCREYLRWSTATDVETCTVCGCLGSALRLSEVKALVRVPRSPQATQFLQESLDSIS